MLTRRGKKKPQQSKLLGCVKVSDQGDGMQVVV